MKALLVLAMVGACASDPQPSSSTLTPAVEVRANAAEMSAGVAFSDENHVADVDVTFRNHTWHLGHPTDHYYGVNVYIPLDHPVEKEEPIVFTVDGIEMTFAVPPAFDFVDVPQFISRSGTSTITWTESSADEIDWYTPAETCARGGGQLPPNATSVTTTPDDWHVNDPFPASSTCATDLQFTRVRTGTVDPAFAGGQVELDQSFDVVFASTP